MVDKLKVVYISGIRFICSQRPGSMMAVCLVQRLLGEGVKQCSPLKRD